MIDANRDLELTMTRTLVYVTRVQHSFIEMILSIAAAILSTEAGHRDAEILFIILALYFFVKIVGYLKAMIVMQKRADYIEFRISTRYDGLRS